MNREGVEKIRTLIKRQNKIKQTNVKKQKIFVLHKGRGKEYVSLVLRRWIWLFLLNIVSSFLKRIFKFKQEKFLNKHLLTCGYYFAMTSCLYSTELAKYAKTRLV